MKSRVEDMIAVVESMPYTFRLAAVREKNDNANRQFERVNGSNANMIYDDKMAGYVVEKEEKVMVVPMTKQEMKEFFLLLRSEVYGFLTRDKNRNKFFCQIANEYVSGLDIESLYVYTHQYLSSGQLPTDKLRYESAIRKIYLSHGVLLSMDAMSQGVVYAMNPFTYLYSHIVELSQSGCLLFREDYRAELAHVSLVDRAHISAYLIQDQLKLKEDDHEFLKNIASGIPTFLGAYVEVEISQIEQIVRIIRMALEKKVVACIPAVVKIEIDTTRALEAVGDEEIESVELESYISYDVRDQETEAIALVGDGEKDRDIDDPKLVPVLSKLRLGDLMICTRVCKRWRDVAQFLMKKGYYKWPHMKGYPFSEIYMMHKSRWVSDYVDSTIASVCNRIVYDVIGTTFPLQAGLSTLEGYRFPEVLALTALIVIKCEDPINTFVRGLALMDRVYEDFPREILIGIKGIKRKMRWGDYPDLSVVYRPRECVNSFKRVYDMLLKKAKVYNGLKIYVTRFKIKTF